MRRALKTCANPTCTSLTTTTYCATHTPAPWAGSTRRQRLPNDWERRRKRILARDPICKGCGNALSTDVDHIHNGDDHDDTNLQGLCANCHKRKTQREAATARRRR